MHPQKITWSSKYEKINRNWFCSLKFFSSQSCAQLFPFYYQPFLSKLFHLFTLPSWMLYLTYFLDNCLLCLLFKLPSYIARESYWASFNSLPSISLTHFVASLLRIVDSLGTKELRQHTGRRTSQIEQASPSWYQGKNQLSKSRLVHR